MNRATWIAGIAILIIALGGAYFFSIRQNAQTTTQGTDTTGNATVGANGASTIIAYTDDGFLSSAQTISPGTTVTWVNQSSRQMWVESATDRGSGCPHSGSVLDACQGVGKGGTYSYTFTALGTFSYVNHAQISDGGTIIVSNASSSGPINPGAIPE